MSRQPRPLMELELRPVAAPVGASAGATVYVLLPTLAELLGCPGFGDRAPIVMPEAPRPFDPFAFFGNAGRTPALAASLLLH